MNPELIKSFTQMKSTKKVKLLRNQSEEMATMRFHGLLVANSHGLENLISSHCSQYLFDETTQ